MIINSTFWDAVVVGDTYDRLYSSDDHADYFKDFISNGVFATPANNLQVVENNNLQIKINTGTCFINGRRGNTDIPVFITLDAADYTYPRIDRIVIKSSKITRAISIECKKGVANGIPVAPDITRNDDEWELSLATIYVGANVTAITQANITDTRSDNNVCGFVTGVVEQIDTTDLFAQYETEWQLLKGACEDDAPTVISAWNELNATKSVNAITPVNGNISINLDNIPDGDTYKKQKLVQQGTATTPTNGLLTVTFPTAYNTAPHVMVCPATSDTAATYSATVYNITTTGFTVKTRKSISSSVDAGIPFNWLAMGV